jgi:hypothetical protein
VYSGWLLSGATRFTLQSFLPKGGKKVFPLQSRAVATAVQLCNSTTFYFLTMHHFYCKPKPAIIKAITFLLFVTLTNFLQAQTCNCNTQIKNYTANWQKNIQNANTFKINSVTKVGRIQNQKQKNQIIALLTHDTAWLAIPASGKTVFAQIGRFDTLVGRILTLPDDFSNYDTTYQKPFLLPGQTQPTRKVSFATKSKRKIYFDTTIQIGNTYYMQTFTYGTTIFSTPVICTAKYCNLVGNIVRAFFIKKIVNGVESFGLF